MQGKKLYHQRLRGKILTHKSAIPPNGRPLSIFYVIFQLSKAALSQSPGFKPFTELVPQYNLLYLLFIYYYYLTLA